MIASASDERNAYAPLEIVSPLWRMAREPENAKNLPD
jgi:hypothetical protein